MPGRSAGRDTPFRTRKTCITIAADQFINKETARSLIRNVYQKLAVDNKAEALRVAESPRWIGSQPG